MKKTRETLSPTLTTILFVLGVVGAVNALAKLLDFAFNHALYTHGGSMPDAILCVLVMCLGCVVACTPLFLLSLILGKPTAFSDYSNCIESYAITDEIVLPHQETRVYDKYALISTTYYVQYSYCELEAAYYTMKRYGNLSYVFSALELPAPFGAINLRISKSTAKRLLKQMSPNQYVVLSNTLRYTYAGENLMPEQETYISRRDLRRIARRLLMHPNASAVYPSIRVCCRAGEFVDVDQVKINEWADQLEGESRHISITPRKEYAHGIYLA